ncbi:MAG TPA: HEAT repeat domain-containing protein [Verrucomicrobiae bacterium]|nr:HEAT repeat domain-containing protein [Verrucomicrobiae bacterium]
MTEPSGPVSTGVPGVPETPHGEPEPGFASEMSRLFIIPAAIVLLCVGVFVLFGLIASEGRTAADYLQEIRQGVEGRRWQAAYELSRLLSRNPEDQRKAGVGIDIAAILADPKTTDPLVKRYLVVALEAIADPATAPALETLLADPDLEVRLYSARALGRLASPTSVKPLVALLENDEPALRKIALYSLGRIGDASAVPAMRPRLEDTVEEVRWNAALSLAVLGDGAGAATLKQMLDPAYLDKVAGITEEQKLEARVNALQAVLKLKDPALRPLVEDVSRNDPSLHVRDIALKVLDRWT